MPNAVSHAALTWRKSSRSHQEGACVELADLPVGVAVRDSKNPNGPVLAVHLMAAAALARRIKAGEFDL